MAKKDKKKPISTGMTTRDKMIERKKKLTEKGSGNGFVFPKEGTIRVRVLSQGPDEELGFELLQFYNPKGSIISPATFDEPCPILEKYKELKNSSDPVDQELAKKLAPKRRYIIGVTCYSDEKGKTIDQDRVGKAMMIPSSVYQDIIDLYLDEDDWGDMTDPKDGYDIKITRSGKGLTDTNYSVTACPRGRSPELKFMPEVNLAEIVRGMTKSYDELEEVLDELLNGAIETEEDDEDEDDTPKKKDKKKKKKDKDPDKRKKKKNKAKDI